MTDLADKLREKAREICNCWTCCTGKYNQNVDCDAPRFELAMAGALGAALQRYMDIHGVDDWIAEMHQAAEELRE